jgi:hypothetical protein
LEKAMSQTKEKLSAAIKTMEDFLNTAKREIARKDISDSRAVEAVLHNFAWGQANATSQIKDAVSYIKP